MGSRLKVTKPEPAGAAPRRRADGKAELLFSQSGCDRAKKDKVPSVYPENERDAGIRKQ